MAKKRPAPAPTGHIQAAPAPIRQIDGLWYLYTQQFELVRELTAEERAARGVANANE